MTTDEFVKDIKKSSGNYSEFGCLTAEEIVDYFRSRETAMLEEIEKALMGGDRPKKWGIASHEMYIQCVNEALSIIQRIKGGK